MRKNVKKLASLILTMCIVLSLFALPFGNASAAETVQTVDVVLFSGQSNMDGIGKSTDAPVVIEPGTAYQYNPTAKTITNLNEAPLYYKETTTAGAVGPVLAWCKAYYEKTGRPIVAVNGAYSGAPIIKFTPGDAADYYSALKSKLNAAVDAVNADSSKKLGNVYLAWCQGESDINDTGNYIKRFDLLFNGLKSDCGVSKAFVMNIGFQCKVNSARAAEYGLNRNLQQVQRNMCALNDDYVMVCDLLKYFNGYEYRDALGYHFKQYCYNIFGEEAGTKMAEYLQSGEKPELSEYTFCPHTNRTLVETKVYDGDTVKLGYKKYKCASPTCILNTLVTKDDEKGIFYEDLVYTNVAECSHTFNTTVTSATCTEGVYSISTCAKCGKVEKTLMGPPLGHDEQVVTVPATCTVDGSITTTCSRCTYKTVVTVKAAGHKFESSTITKPATCTEDGVETGVCTVCGEETTNPIPAIGHNYGEWIIVKPATTTEAGRREKLCVNCKDVISEVIPKLEDGNYSWNYRGDDGRADYDKTMSMSTFVISRDYFGKYDTDYLSYDLRKKLAFSLYGENNNTSKYRPANNTQAVVINNLSDADGNAIAPKAFKLNGGFDIDAELTGTVSSPLPGIVLAEDESGYYSYYPSFSSSGKTGAVFLYSPKGSTASNGTLNIKASSNTSDRLFVLRTPKYSSVSYNGKNVPLSAVSAGSNYASQGRIGEHINALAAAGVTNTADVVPDSFTPEDYARITVDYNATVSGDTITLNYAFNFKFDNGDVITFNMVPFIINSTGYNFNGEGLTDYSCSDYNASTATHSEFRQRFGYSYYTIGNSTSYGYAVVNNASLGNGSTVRNYNYDSADTGLSDYYSTKSNSTVFNGSANFGTYDGTMLNYDGAARLGFYTYVKESNYRITNKVQGIALNDVDDKLPTTFNMNGGYYPTNRETITGPILPGVVLASDDNGYYNFSVGLGSDGSLGGTLIYTAASAAVDGIANTGISTTNRFFISNKSKITGVSYNGVEIDDSNAGNTIALYKSNSYLTLYIKELAYKGYIPSTSVVPTKLSAYDSKRMTVDYKAKNIDGKITLTFDINYNYDNGDVITIHYNPLIITEDGYTYNGGSEVKFAGCGNQSYNGTTHENFTARFGYSVYNTWAISMQAYAVVNNAKISFTSTEIDDSDCTHTNTTTKAAVAATCDKAGKTEEIVCADCGAHISGGAAIPALGHIYVTNCVEPTCTAAGSEITTCSRCDYESVVSLPATGHKFSSLTVTKPATCTEAGEKTGSCTVCGEKVTETIPATGHTWGEWVVVTPATKTSTGLKKHTCSTCSKEETETIPMLASDIVYDWTYTDTATAGANAVADTLDKSTVTADVITHAVAKQFSDGNNQVNSVGNNIGFLSMSGSTIAAFNIPDGYRPSEFTLVAPNYTSNNGMHVATGAPVIGRVSKADGENVVYSVYVASVRNSTEHTRCELVLQGSDGSSKVIAMNLTNPVTGATGNTYNAVKGGYLDGLFRNNLTYTYNIVPGDDSVTVNISIQYDRPTAGEVYTFVADPIVINAADLADGEFTPAFGIASGMLNNAVNLSAKVYSAKAVYKNGDATEECEHKNTKTIAAVAATCTTAGKTEEVVCADCGAHISGGETTKALGHNYKTVTVESTCTVKGSTTTTCSRCDYKDVKELPLKDHTAAAERKGVKAATCTAEGYTGDVVCKDCGTVIEAGKTIAKADHTPSDWIIDTPATATSDGSKHTECTVCDTVLETEVIPATGRAYGDVNGDGVIDASDAMAVLRYDSLLANLTDDLFTVADVNGDGNVNPLDAILILQYDARIIDQFPITAVLPIDEH